MGSLNKEELRARFYEWANQGEEPPSGVLCGPTTDEYWQRQVFHCKAFDLLYPVQALPLGDCRLLLTGEGTDILFDLGRPFPDSQEVASLIFVFNPGVESETYYRLEKPLVMVTSKGCDSVVLLENEERQVRGRLHFAKSVPPWCEGRVVHTVSLY